MATAAQPAFEPARRGGRGKGEGDLNKRSKQYSSRELPSHTKIKYRQTTQDAPEDVWICDFRRELEHRESCCCKVKIEIGQPENTQPLLQCQRSSIGPDSCGQAWCRPPSNRRGRWRFWRGEWWWWHCSSSCRAGKKLKQKELKHRPGRNTSRSWRRRESYRKTFWVETLSLIPLAHPSLRPASKLREGGMMMLSSRTVQKV